MTPQPGGFVIIPGYPLLGKPGIGVDCRVDIGFSVGLYCLVDFVGSYIEVYLPENTGIGWYSGDLRITGS